MWRTLHTNSTAVHIKSHWAVRGWSEDGASDAERTEAGSWAASSRVRDQRTPPCLAATPPCRRRRTAAGAGGHSAGSSAAVITGTHRMLQCRPPGAAAPKRSPAWMQGHPNLIKEDVVSNLDSWSDSCQDRGNIYTAAPLARVDCPVPQMTTAGSTEDEQVWRLLASRVGMPIGATCMGRPSGSPS